jgi:siderophore synthetase component
MTHLSQQLANSASFQAFINCYLHEIDEGQWTRAVEWESLYGITPHHAETHVVELQLPPLGCAHVLGAKYRSLVGRHTITSVYRLQGSPPQSKRLDFVSAQLLLIDALYVDNPESKERLELIARVIESHQVMAIYLSHHLQNLGKLPFEKSPSSFLNSEQSLVLGHWFHPTPKSRQGLHMWQHTHYVPELQGRFRLNFFAASREIVQQESLLNMSAEEIGLHIACRDPDIDHAQRLKALLGEGYCLLPLHPLQAQHLLHQDHVRELLKGEELIDLGAMGPLFSPTSSVRTVYCETLHLMLKLSIPVKLTNSLRINLKSELKDSVLVSQLVRECKIAERFSRLKIIEDPAYITVSLLDREETGFEIIYRQNPFVEEQEAGRSTVVHSIAALVQDPLQKEARSLLHEQILTIAGEQGLSLRQASRRWFDAYFRCAIELPLRLYDEVGIVLEAHQQNSLLDFTREGYPENLYYRDVQGIGLAEHKREQLTALIPDLAKQPRLFESDKIVQNGFGYYLIFNHLFAVINRFGLDGLLSEDELLSVVGKKLQQLRPSLQILGARFIDALLKKEAIPCKANLRTRIAGLDELEAEDELAVYILVKNPLYASRSREVRPTPSFSPAPCAST